MAVVIGNDVGLYVNNQLIGCLTSNNVDLQRELIETTCKDQGGARSVKPGGTSGSFPFSGNFNPASNTGLDDLIAIFANGTRVGIKQAVDEGLFIAAYAYLTNLSWAGELNAASTFSGTFEVDGPVTYGDET